MQIQVPVHRLKHALELVEPAVARKATLPITQNVLFQKGGVHATNLELSISAELREIQGLAFTLPHGTLTNLLRHVPNAELATIEYEGGVATIIVGGDRLRLHGTDAGDFPPVPQVPGDGELVDGDRFLKALLGAVPYTAGPKEAARPVLQAVCFTLGDPITVAASDGFRIAWQDAPLRLTGEGSGVKQLLVPRDSVQALEKVWRRAVKPPTASPAELVANFPKLNQGPSLETARMAVARRMMRVRMTAGGASLQFGEATLYTQLLQGQFPNFHQVIPEELPNKVTFDAEAVYRVVRMLAPIAEEASGIIRIQWEDKTMELSGRSEKQGEASGAVAVTTHGEPGSIAFKVGYLLEYLAGKYGLVLMETVRESSPARFTHPGSSHMLLQPMFVASTRPAAAAPAQDGATAAPEGGTVAGQEQPAPSAPPKPTTRRGRGKPVEGGHSIEATMEVGSREEQPADVSGGATRSPSLRPKPRRRTSSGS